MRLRVAGPADAGAVRGLTGAGPATGAHVVLAEDRDGPAGTAALAPDGTLSDLAIRPGLAPGTVLPALYDAVEAEAVRLGLPRLRIDRPEAELAAFLSHRGWVKAGGGAMVRDRVGRA